MSRRTCLLGLIAIVVGGCESPAVQPDPVPVVPPSPPRRIRTLADINRAALVALYHATGGDNWTSNTNWLSTKHIREWHGVLTHQDSTVSHLQLHRNNLVGALPPEIGDLVNLNELSLSGNPELKGPIPPEFGKLTNLIRLQLWHNGLTGQFPPEMAQFNWLETLLVWEKGITGPMPAFGESSRLWRLKKINLNTSMSGQIPESFIGLRRLDSFVWQPTDLCAPQTEPFIAWLRDVEEWRGWFCGEREPGYQIELVFADDVPVRYHRLMKAAAGFWEEVLSENELRDFGSSRRLSSQQPLVVDDLVIDVRSQPLSGLATGTPTDIRHGAGLFASASYVLWDITRADPYSDDVLVDVAKHVIGHALGIGTTWDVHDLVADETTVAEELDTHFSGPLALEAFNAAGGSAYTGRKIPVQQYVHDSHIPDNAHWRGSVFGAEIMSNYWIYSASPPVSAITLQSLADLGYLVNLDLAEPYTLPDGNDGADVTSGVEWCSPITNMTMIGGYERRIPVTPPP